MGGYRVSLDIGRGALAAAQNSLAITGNNIANVSTTGYSRQSAILSTRQPVAIGNFQYGSGVTIEDVTRHIDELLEERLVEQKSLYAASSESLLYMDNLEGLFNIQSDSNLDGRLSDFWNTWHDLSNNPSGTAERKVVYEQGVQLSEQFNNLNNDIVQLENHIDQEIQTGVAQVNDILKQIAALNSEINQVEASMPANDQRDARARLVTELSGFMSINTIDRQEQQGFLTILTDNGYPLVIGNGTFPLSVSSGRVEWTTSAGGKVDISDEIEGGKISGWLSIKEEVIAKTKTDLDVLAKEMIWNVNSVHSGGVGQNYYSTRQTGTYVPSQNGLLSTLPFGDKIDYTKDFKMWVKDSQQPPVATSLEVDMAISDTEPAFAGAAASADFQYNFTVTTAGTVGSGADDPVISWEKIDPVTGVATPGGLITIGDAAVNYAVDGGMTLAINPGYLVAGNTFSVNTDATGVASPLDIARDPTKRAASVLDTYTFKVASGGGNLAGVSEANPMVIEWESSYGSGSFTLDDPANLTVEVDGMELTFNNGVLFNDEAFVIKTNAQGFPEDSTGTFDIETSSDWHWTMDSFKDQFNAHAVAAGVSNVCAKVTFEGALEFVPDSGYSFAFSDSQAEDSGLTAALGINTFFTGDNANTIEVNSAMEDTKKIAASRIDGGESNGMISDKSVSDPATTGPLVINAANANNTIVFEENGVIRTATLTNNSYTSKTDFHSLAADIQAQMEAAVPGPGLGAGIYKVAYNEDDNQFIISKNDKAGLTSLEIFWDLNPNTATALGFEPEEKTYIPPNGESGVSDNKNSLLISDLQYSKTSTAQWTYSRGSMGISETVSTYSEEYYQGIISSLGITSAALHQNEEFGSIMVEKMTEQRDSISGVSIDEEMVNLMLFQQSYTAASKLITTVDEMMVTLLGIK